jgi:hypothetical protein
MVKPTCISLSNVCRLSHRYLVKIKYSQFKKMALTTNHLSHCRGAGNAMSSNLAAAFFQMPNDLPLHPSSTRHALHPNKIPILTTNSGLKANAAKSSPFAKASPARVAPQLGQGIPKTRRNVQGGSSAKNGAANLARKKPSNKMDKSITLTSKGGVVVGIGGSLLPAGKSCNLKIFQ